MKKKYNKIIVAKKIGMTQHQDKNGVVRSCTVLSLSNCQYFNPIDSNIDNFKDVFISYGDKNISKLNKPKRSFLSKYKIESSSSFFRVSLPNNIVTEKTAILDFNVFSPEEKVNVRSLSKGNGFTGTIKKGFSRGPMSHGSKSKRGPGSIGGGTTPGHVLKGTTMGGRTGNSKVTIKNLTILEVRDNLMFISGAIPGKRNFVEIFN